MAGLFALGGIAFQLAGVMAVWVYLVPLGNQSGISTDSMRLTISGATGIQILAGPLAIVLAGRLTAWQVVVATAAIELAALLATVVSGAVLVWVPALIVFAFCWLFVTPFYISFLISADPTRRSALFVSTAQLIGVSVGPLLASVMISSFKL